MYFFYFHFVVGIIALFYLLFLIYLFVNIYGLLSNDVCRRASINPFTPKSDQYQISPAASPEILHHTVWITWLFIAYSNER